MSQTSATRATCRSCKTRYDVSRLSAGMPFSCRHCGEVVYAPGERKETAPCGSRRRFGEIALECGWIHAEALNAALAEQDRSRSGRRRLGELLVEAGALSPTQVAEVLRRQGAELAFRLPGYEIVEKLGEGGMGSVYKGVHLASRKTVAIKILADRLLRRPEFVERFHREARVAIDLDHPNIVKGYDEGSVDSMHYFVMAYVHGKSAARVLRKRGQFSERRSLDLVRQIAHALDYAHARGIVHRDIKPDNILITRKGHAMLADYGLVKLVEDIDVAGLTSAGQVLGTPNYISPEQARGEKQLDIRSDLYSLGATLYHFATGQPPFKGKNSAITLGMHLRSPLTDPREVNPQLSRMSATIIQTLLAKDPAKRYQTPRELIAAINDNLAHPPPRIATKRPSGATMAAPSAWGAVSEILSSDADVTDALAVSGGQKASASRFAPLLFGVGVLLLLVALGVPVGLLVAHRYRTTQSNTPLQPADDPSGGASTDGGSPPPEPAPPTTEELAARLVKQALAERDEARIRLLEQTIERYPGTAGAELASRELADLSRRAEEAAAAARAEAEDAARIAQQKREVEASKAYQALSRIAHADPDRHLPELEAFSQKYRGTQAARRARTEAQTLREAAARAAAETEALRRLKEEEARRVAEREQARRDQLARTEFLRVYREALGRFDLDAAAHYARLLEGDKRHPNLQPLARDCAADVADLAHLYPAVTRALTAPGRDEQTLIFEPAMKLNGVVGSVRKNVIFFLVDGKNLQEKPISSLVDSEIERLCRKGLAPDGPPADRVLGLYYIARGNRERARTLLNRVAKTDPRRKHHQQLLKEP